MPFAGFVAANGDLNLDRRADRRRRRLARRHLRLVYRRAPAGPRALPPAVQLAGRVSPPFPKTISTQAAHWFDRYGHWAVLLGRLIPAIRTLISVPAGLAAMPVGKFLAVSAIGTAIWTAFLTAAGYLLHEHYDAVEGLGRSRSPPASSSSPCSSISGASSPGSRSRISADPERPLHVGRMRSRSHSATAAIHPIRETLQDLNAKNPGLAGLCALGTLRAFKSVSGNLFCVPDVSHSEPRPVCPGAGLLTICSPSTCRKPAQPIR